MTRLTKPARKRHWKFALALPVLMWGAIVASVAATAPAPAPFNICGDDDCICAAHLDHRPNVDVDTSLYVTSCGISYGVGKNGCCRIQRGIECEEKQCIFALNYCAIATPGTILGWVCRRPDQTTDEAIANGQYVIEGPSTNVVATIKLSCGQGLVYEVWAYNPTLVPTTVMLDSFAFDCANCPAQG